ncbi:MAG: hypothetical protein ACRYHA_32665 [Janthinobacterium lividum]
MKSTIGPMKGRIRSINGGFGLASADVGGVHPGGGVGRAMVWGEGALFIVYAL